MKKKNRSGRRKASSKKVDDTISQGKVIENKSKDIVHNSLAVEKKKRTFSSLSTHDKDERKAPPGPTGCTTKRQRSASSSETHEKVPATIPDFPFAVISDDHCETPLMAYRDIEPFLSLLHRSAPSKHNMCIYDPYYCNGSVEQHLHTLGFCNVYHRKEDCYQRWKTAETCVREGTLTNDSVEGTATVDNSNTETDGDCVQLQLPQFDVLVTNPPYSENHMEKLMCFVTSKQFGDRPWFLLLPQWVHKKDFYEKACVSACIRPFYLVPRHRYVYLPPKDFRAAKKSDVHRKSSPFVSMWYCWGGTDSTNERWIRLFHQLYSSKQSGDNSTTVDLARSRNALRDLRRKHR